jgi:hypothetical protein
MTELQNNNDLSSTSSAFMTEIAEQKQNGASLNNTLSATSSANMTELQNNNDLSSTSSAFMTEILKEQQLGGVKRKMQTKRRGRKAQPTKAEKDDDSTSSSSLSDSDDSDSDSSSDDLSDSMSGGKYMNGTRYLMSETTSIQGGSDVSETSSSLSTEDLRFFRK